MNMKTIVKVSLGLIILTFSLFFLADYLNDDTGGYTAETMAPYSEQAQAREHGNIQTQTTPFVYLLLY